MNSLKYLAATVALASAAALAVGWEDARPSVEGTPPPEAAEATSPLDDLTAFKRDVEAGAVDTETLAAVMAEGNAAGRFEEVAGLAETALGTPSSVVEAAEAARDAAARAEERLTGEPPAESETLRLTTHAGLPVYQRHAPIRNEAGVAYYELNRVADAHECFLSAVALDARYDEPHANLGLLYRRKGWYDKALESYGAALEIRPTNPTVWYNRAVALLRLGRIEEAVASLETAAKLAPKYRPPLKRLALIWYDLGDYGAARDYARKLLYLAETDETATEDELKSAAEILTLAQNRLEGKKAEPTLTVEGTSAPPP
jgi:tetratricopeptide (TPR) repeat protein